MIILPILGLIAGLLTLVVLILGAFIVLGPGDNDDLLLTWFLRTAIAGMGIVVLMLVTLMISAITGAA